MMHLTEAFKKMDLLNEDTFEITNDGLEKLKEFENQEFDDDYVEVIDTEAETEDDISDSYIGQVILDCNVCHSKLYKNKEDVVVEEENANIEEECPFCYSTEGFKVIGEVAPYGETADNDEDSEEVEETEDETKEETDDVEVEETENELELDESLDTEEVEDKEELEEAAFSGGYASSDSRDTSKRAGGQKKVWKDANDGKKTKTIKAKDLKPGMITDTGKVTEVTDMGWVNGKPTVEISYGGIGAQGSHASDVVAADKDYQVLDESNSINENINNLSLDTDDTHMEMTSDGNGKVTITTEPTNNMEDSEQVIAPVSDETEADILDNGEEEVTDETTEDETIDLDMEEFDEESFDGLGESYLKKVYENVNSFKTSNVSFAKDKLIVEGVIKFNSGNSKKTNFIFGIREATKSGKVRFIGENKEISRGRKSFTVTGKIADKKFLSESFNYNYGVKTDGGKVKRLYGTVKNK